MEGCFWAALFSVIVLDFTDSLQEWPEEFWLDVHEIMDPEWMIYENKRYAGIRLQNAGIVGIFFCICGML